MSAQATRTLNQIAHCDPLHTGDNTTPWQYLIIGAGPVGMRMAEELLACDPMARVRVLGQEAVMPYDRIKLTSLLAGDVQRASIDLSLPSKVMHPGFDLKIATAAHIDRAEKLVIDDQGQVYDYDTLILATGSRAHIPDVPGVECEGVYTLRSLRDSETLSARLSRARHMVVVGGGLLGIEAAKAMLKANTHVTLIHQGPTLMNRLLHESAARALEKRLREMGIYVICQSGARKIHGTERVEGVRTRDGTEIKCDSVLLCTGIRPNIDLARKAGLAVSQGINVNDFLCTADPDIFAVGECAEHRGATYGLVGPGFEQAGLLARHLHRRWLDRAVHRDVDLDDTSLETLRYVGSQALSRLKVLGDTVCSMGEVVDLPRRPFQSIADFSSRRRHTFRRVVVYRGKLLGFSGVGEWPELNRLQQAYLDETRIWPWQLWLFRLSGRLWLRQPPVDVTAWADDVLVCQCNRLSKGQLCAALNEGDGTLESLQQQTRAGTVCGGCQPLLAELVSARGEGSAALGPEKGRGIALGAGLLALLLLGVFLLMPAETVSDSVQTRTWYESIWNDGFWKQVTGFSLLGTSLLGLLMSLRKRLNWQWMGQFANWRGVHLLLGVSCLALLALHTGLHMGTNLNRWLLVDFLAVLALGGLSALMLAFGHKLKPASASRWRSRMTTAHIYITWPLPVLLIMHVLSVYYF